jgi:hypothetical protein
MYFDDSRQTSGFAPHVEPPQRRFEIVHQGAKGPAQRFRPRDHHVVVPPLRMLRHNRSDGGTQAPTCTVPLDGASDASACGKSNAERVRVRLLPARLQN